jgi:hypothetical protein
MAGNLVTIATFDMPPKARLAQNALQEAGIKSTVADETTVAMDWLLGAAVGWVKIQVLEEDAERAVAVLEEALGKDEAIDEESLAAQADAAPSEEGRDHSVPVRLVRTAPADEPKPEAEPKPSEREEYARRFFASAIFGLIFPLFWFYALYLFLNTAFGTGPLSRRGETKLWAGTVIMVFGFFMTYIILRLYGNPFP